jgi:hypothetical protein
MAITYDRGQGVSFQSIESLPKNYYGLSSDTKPTVASHSGLPEPASGSTFWAYDTNILYKTYDGTNWILYVTLG